MAAASGTSLNRTTGQQTGDYAPDGTGTIRKSLAIAGSTTAVNQTIGVIPSNAVILAGSGVAITTGFNGTTPTINVGYAADNFSILDMDAYATVMALPTTKTFVPLDEILTATATARPIATTVTANLNFTDSTAGACDVIIIYCNG